EIDAFQEADVPEILPAAFADHRQDTEIVAVVENRGKIVGEGEISGVRIARNDGNRVLIDLIAELLHGARVASGRLDRPRVLGIGYEGSENECGENRDPTKMDTLAHADICAQRLPQA